MPQGRQGRQEAGRLDRGPGMSRLRRFRSGSVRLRVRRTVAVAGSALAAATLAIAVSAPTAGQASSYVPSADPNECINAQPGSQKAADISRAVWQVTGNYALYGVCNPNLYNGGEWSSLSELEGYVDSAMNACGPGQTNRNLAQAVLEKSAVPAEGFVCAKQVYQDWIDANCTTTSCNTVNWNVYKTAEEAPDTGSGAVAPGEQSASFSVAAALQACNRPAVTQAVIQLTGSLPERREAWWPSVGGAQNAGQCHAYIYNHGDFEFSYDYLVGYAKSRMQSTETCPANPDIAYAYEDLTGWKPLPFECDPDRYKGGDPSNYTDLRNDIAYSFRCTDPWIDQVYKIDFGRAAHGRGTTGECNPNLYGNGHWSSYNDLRTKMGVTVPALQSSDAEFHVNGSLTIAKPGGSVSYPPASVLIKTPSGAVSTAGGDVIANGGANLLGEAGGNVISYGGGNVISYGGGNVIANGGANVIASGGGNVIASGGGNLISDKGMG